jgi:hypothetical protein
MILKFLVINYYLDVYSFRVLSPIYILCKVNLIFDTAKKMLKKLLKNSCVRDVG